MNWGARFSKKRGSETKHGNEQSLCALGHSHRSKLESSVCQMLQLRMKAGEIAEIHPEKHIRVCGPPGHECTHKTKVDLVVDFMLTRPDGSVFYAEAKGIETTDYRIKRRLWMHNGIGELEIWKGTWQRPLLDEIIGGSK